MSPKCEQKGTPTANQCAALGLGDISSTQRKGSLILILVSVGNRGLQGSKVVIALYSNFLKGLR